MTRVTDNADKVEIFRALVTTKYSDGVVRVHAFGPYSMIGSAKAAAKKESYNWRGEAWPSRIERATVNWEAVE